MTFNIVFNIQSRLVVNPPFLGWVIIFWDTIVLCVALQSCCVTGVVPGVRPRWYNTLTILGYA